MTTRYDCSGKVEGCSASDDVRKLWCQLALGHAGKHETDGGALWETPETEDFSAGVAMMSAAMTSPEARETLRLSFFIAALTGSAQITTKDPASDIALDALKIANAAIETWYARDKK